MAVNQNGIEAWSMNRFLRSVKFELHYNETNGSRVTNRINKLIRRAEGKGVKVTMTKDNTGLITVTFVGPPEDMQYILNPPLPNRRNTRRNNVPPSSAAPRSRATRRNRSRTHH